MLDPITILKGLNTVGWGNVYKALIFGLRKLRMESAVQRELKRKAKEQSPIGSLKNFSPTATGAIVAFEHAELTVQFLTEDFVRSTWTPGVLPVPYAIAKDDWPGAEVALSETDSGWQLTTRELVVTIGSDGSLAYTDSSGHTLRSELPPTITGDGWTHSAALREEEHLYGLGQRNHAMNLRGGSYLLWNEEPMGDYNEGKDPIYVCIPAYIGLHAEGSYLVFFENTHMGTVSFKDSATAHFHRGALRYYFAPGPPKRALDRYTELTGRPAMPPKWALGYHQCRWSYQSEAEAMEVANGFVENDLPISALHLDIHYMDGYRVFTVDQKRFPDLSRLAASLHARDIKMITILDPGVKQDPEYDLYQEGNTEKYFCRLQNGEIVHGPVWPGYCGFPDFTDPAVRKWWGEQYVALTEQGVDGYWHDMNEPAAFSSTGRPTLPLSTVHKMEGRCGDHVEAHNVYAQLENRAAFEGLRKLQPDRRPWLLTRSGWTGVQRWAWNWTGDTGCNWWSLKHNLRLSIMLGLSGWPYTGSDTGGFNGHPLPELYIRWFQLSAFHPFFRTHSAAFVPRREPWSFGAEITDIARDYLKLRYRLMPYWYTLAHNATENGEPLVRPMWWKQPQDQRLWDIDDQFMLGDSLLVAPVVEPGAISRNVVLPEGEWICFWCGKRITGFDTFEAKAPLERLPMFVRAGSMLPLEEDDTLTLRLYLPSDPKPFEASIYSDAGDGYGPSRNDTFSVSPTENGWKITRNATGEFEWPYRKVRVEVAYAQIVSADVDGNPAELSDGGIVSDLFSECIFTPN